MDSKSSLQQLSLSEIQQLSYIFQGNEKLTGNKDFLLFGQSSQPVYICINIESQNCYPEQYKTCKIHTIDFFQIGIQTVLEKDIIVPAVQNRG